MEELYIDFKVRLLFEGNRKALFLSIVIAFILALGAGILLFYGGNWFNYYWVVYGIGIGVESYLNLKGKSLSQFFGRTYFDLNQDRISYRPILFKKVKILVWEEVREIQFLSNRVLLKSPIGGRLEIEFGRFTYLEVQKVKETIRKMAKVKGIQLA